MTKSDIKTALERKLGQTIEQVQMTTFFRCFADHAHYLAKFYHFSPNNIRSRKELIDTRSFTTTELRLFSLYCGYDLTKSGLPALW